MASAASRRVTSTDGVSLAVYESGPPDAPTVLAVHGYPDNHAVWDGLVDVLDGRFRVVTYDVRGAGASDKPGSVGAYRMPQLVDDLVAVMDAISSLTPAHLLGHDWGSVQLWPALTDDRLAGRIASFTSISGPSLDYAAAWLRGGRQHPWAVLRQLAHSYYVGVFQLPALPELAIRRGVLGRGVARAGGAQVARTDVDALNGLQLYRANVARRVTRPRPVPAAVPVQVIVPARDPFITAEFAVEAPRPWVDDLTVHHVPGGHWVVAEDPELVGGLVRDFVSRNQAGRPSSSSVPSSAST